MALLRIERGGDDHRVAIVTLDAAERRNSLTLEMVEEIVAAFDEIDADEGVGAVVVTGAERRRRPRAPGRDAGEGRQ
jgi:enoyl-CoA hydratase/carnithine racemase